ncbi:hypothetical protein ESCO_001360 [Escovopsis weberi]|uniref:DUF7136 domain-containing protein n=1 Tax=Escovopsis weberi TaxID=150374 RepID=A0A0M8MUU5_ESCWE|nr:hypothetical protein ESCO_001360 [Escovopsis weberi]
MPSLLRLLGPFSAWGLLAPVAAAAEVIDSISTTGNSTTTGVFEVDIVFPRNQTYAPSPHMPIVFAVHNLELGLLINPAISFDVWSTKTNISKNYGDTWYLGMGNRSGDPFAYQGYANYDTEDHWIVDWRLDWESCFKYAGYGAQIMGNSTGGRIEFTTSKEAPQGLDLVAALQDASTCQTTCGVAAPSLPAPSPCAVTVDAAAATSIAAQITAGHILHYV